MAAKGKTITVTEKVVIADEYVRIIKLLADGNGVPEITEITGVDKRTVEARIASLRKRFGMKTTTQLVAFLVSKGLINL